MKVRVNSLYEFSPCLWDLLHPIADVSKGDVVRVQNMHGCPPANTMSHCYIFNPFTSAFLGMVHTNSLLPVSASTRRLVTRAIGRNRK
jgi:hypothetical protein